MSIRNVLYSILVILVFIAALGVYVIFKPEKTLVNREPDLAITASELFRNYSINEEAANKTFLGKIIQVSGTIREINIDDSMFTSIILETGDLFSGVNCAMDNKYISNQNDILINSEVTIKGECSGKLIDVVLNNCVLIDE